jgi:hypothetical protein
MREREREKSCTEDLWRWDRRRLGVSVWRPLQQAAGRSASVGIEPPSGALVPTDSVCVFSAAAAIARSHAFCHTCDDFWAAPDFNFSATRISGIRFCLLRRKREKRFNVARCAVPFSRRRLSSLDLRFSGFLGKYALHFLTCIRRKSIFCPK